MAKRFNNSIGKEYQLFKLAVPHYDLLQEKLTEPINNLKNKGSIKILEIGCGQGQTTLVLLRNPKVNVIAIDNETLMIKESAIILKNFIEEGKVSLKLCDALDFLKKQEDNSFDVIASGYTIHNFKQDYRRQVLAECYRVLKNTGLFVNADKYAKDNKKEHNADLKWQIDRFKIYDSLGHSDLKQMWTKHYLEDESPEVVMYENTSIEEMNLIGFKKPEITYREHMEAVLVAEK